MQLELPHRGPLVLHYPQSTHVRFFDLAEYSQRVVSVSSIRDLVRQPLTPEEFLRRPFVRRSRYLISSNEAGKFRRFYLGCSSEYAAPSQLRLALYAPNTPKIVDLISRPFGPSVGERKQLAKLLLNCLDKDFDDLVLRVFADDFGVIG
jgi:hypothetical protein